MNNTTKAVCAASGVFITCLIFGAVFANNIITALCLLSAALIAMAIGLDKKKDK